MLAPFRPDHAYCVYCHQEASGPCATCQALICADCAELSGGDVHKVAVCSACHRAGAGQVAARGWWPIFALVVLIIAAALALGLIAEWLH